MEIPQILQHLSFHRMNIRFYPQETIRMNYWIGAVWRNRFLYAAESVRDESGQSLRVLLDTLPLVENHLYYKQLAGGFPKGFLFDCSLLPGASGSFTLAKERIYTVSLVLIGNCVGYYPLFIEALQRMFAEGFGQPLTPLTLIDICEEGGSLLYSGHGHFLNKPSSVYQLPSQPDKPAETTVGLRFKTPVSLMNPAKRNLGEGYQSKLNNFPSFYQFIRSLTYRLMTLHMLYVDPGSMPDKDTHAAATETFIRPAGRALLLEATLCYEKRHSTPREGETAVYTFGGYTGTLVFGQVDTRFLPLLVFGSYLGVGNDINYGLGIYEVV